MAISLVQTGIGFLRESRAMNRLGRNFGARARLTSDVWLSRFAFARRLSKNLPRRVDCIEDTSITYRLNRGDLQSIREVMCDKAYRLPFETHPRTLIDLGANIGLTSVWLHRQYRFETIIAVEPDPANAEVARENFRANGVPVDLIVAAVGPRDGTASFLFDVHRSNIGRVVDASKTPQGGKIDVRMLSMESVLARLPEGVRVDLLKIDIEGGEAPLLRGERTWLKQVDAIIAELHPELVDCAELVRIMEDDGFSFIPSSSVFPGNMTAFVRRS